ncbi:hypothetical protein RND81_07G047900 [Saponaria officinalis]|uniref:Secreted peptide n=1 Tax=Saponaria officinalis TaxID=3572 RepID=A0AAW1JKD9_SAPOF
MPFVFSALLPSVLHFSFSISLSLSRRSQSHHHHRQQSYHHRHPCSLCHRLSSPDATRRLLVFLL